MQEEINRFVSQLKGMPCWDVGASTYTGASFSLSLGGKWKRPPPARNPSPLKSAQVRESGEADLMVWCSWRLDDQHRPILSSDNEAKVVIPGLACLLGKTVTAVEVHPPAWDLKIEFSRELQLTVFCDHVPPDPSLDGNWELSVAEKVLCIGAGSTAKFEPRTTI